MLEYDVVIIGGGIHGVGVAQAAAARGHNTLLIEKSRLAAGTSSRSSKLIHGGLRYLESLELGLVFESLRERRILARIAPELVSWVPFFIPVGRESSRGAWTIRAGLTLYSLLGGFDRHSRFRTIPKRQWQDLDGLCTDDVRTVFQYWDAQTDDALLTAAVMGSAQQLGAELLCPAELLAGHAIDGGYQLDIAIAGDQRSITTRTVVNAAGPWINQVSERFDPVPPVFPVDLVRGTHILVDAELRRGIYYTEAPRDGRAVFVMPWHTSTLIGTTEELFEGEPEDVAPSEEEVAYLLETYAHYFPGKSCKVTGSFAGLRVLPADSGGVTARTRETTLVRDIESEPRMLTIAGGKLTGYRATAARVMATLTASLPPSSRRVDTRHLLLPGLSEIGEQLPVHRAVPLGSRFEDRL